MAGEIGRIHEEQGSDTVDPDEMLDANDIARLWGVSRPRAYSLMASGQLPVIRFGRSVRVPRRKLQEWISREVEAGKQA